MQGAPLECRRGKYENLLMETPRCETKKMNTYCIRNGFCHQHFLVIHSGGVGMDWKIKWNKNIHDANSCRDVKWLAGKKKNCKLFRFPSLGRQRLQQQRLPCRATRPFPVSNVSWRLMGGGMGDEMECYSPWSAPVRSCRSRGSFRCRPCSPPSGSAPRPAPRGLAEERKDGGWWGGVERGMMQKRKR